MTPLDVPKTLTTDTLSAVSTYETDLAVLGREDFWLIVAFRGSEDETEIHSG
jgi:hypothetical protein